MVVEPETGSTCFYCTPRIIGQQHSMCNASTRTHAGTRTPAYDPAFVRVFVLHEEYCSFMLFSYVVFTMHFSIDLCISIKIGFLRSM